MKRLGIKLWAIALVLMMAMVFAGCEGPQGPAGPQGVAGDPPRIEGGTWWIGTVNTGIPATGSAGDTPFIGSNGNWWIGTTDTGVFAQGPAGAPGTPGVPGNLPLIPRIDAGTGTWWIGMVDTTIVANAAENQPRRIVDGYWWIDGEDTLVRAHPADDPRVGALFTPGVFEYTVHGLSGPIRVWVSFSANTILDVIIAEQREIFVHSKPLETIPPQIVQFQTLTVDTVSGSTLTSRLLLDAVEGAVYQATGENQTTVRMLKAVSAVSPRSTQVINIPASLVVVGAGTGGVQAAIAGAEIARQRGYADVVLLEAHSRIGGSGAVRGPGITFANVNIDSRHRPLETTLTDAQRNLLQSRLNEVPSTGLALENRDRFLRWQEILRADHARHMGLSPGRVFDSLAFRIIQGGNPSELDEIAFSAEAQFADVFNRFGVGTWCQETGVTQIGEWPRGYRPGDRGMSPVLQFAELFHETVRRTNLPLRFKPSTPAISLIEYDDVVIGVLAEHVSGRTYRIFSPNTLLTSGSFAANAEWMMIYCNLRNFWTPENHRATTISTNRGDGIRMARNLRLPAAVGNMTTGTGLGTYHAGNINQNFAGGMWNAGANWNMAVNAHGVRFGNEALGPGGGGIHITAAPDPNSVITNTFAQPGQFFWQVVDVFNGFQSPVWHVRGNIYNSFGTQMMQPVPGDDMWSYYTDPANPALGRETRTRWTSHLANRNIQGWPWVVMADTLEELAALMFDEVEHQNAFLDQVNAWNAMIDNQALPEAERNPALACPWGRTAFMTSAAGMNQMPEHRTNLLCPRLINCTGTRPAGPFVASPMRPSSHTTAGGLAVNNGRVLRAADDQPIPGLFASGNVATTFAGAPSGSVPGIYLAGELLVRRVIFAD